MNGDTTIPGISRGPGRRQSTLNMALCIMAGAWTLAAQTPTVVHFDDLAWETLVVNQYAGVSFPDGGFIRTVADSGLASWSMPNQLQKDCTGVEFDAAPLRIQFTENQGWVRVYVGNPEGFHSAR